MMVKSILQEALNISANHIKYLSEQIEEENAVLDDECKVDELRIAFVQIADMLEQAGHGSSSPLFNELKTVCREGNYLKHSDMQVIKHALCAEIIMVEHLDFTKSKARNKLEKYINLKPNILKNHLDKFDYDELKLLADLMILEEQKNMSKREASKKSVQFFAYEALKINDAGKSGDLSEKAFSVTRTKTDKNIESYLDGLL